MSDSVRPTRNYTELSGDEALQRIREGESLNGFEIGSLTLSGEFGKPIVIKACSIKRLTVSDVEFKARVQIRSCDLYRPHFGKDSHFAEGLDLRNSQIYSLTMEGVKFGGSVRLDNAELERHVRFRKCEFGEDLRLWQAHFRQWVEFSGCVFKDKADMRSFVADEGFEHAS